MGERVSSGGEGQGWPKQFLLCRRHREIELGTNLDLYKRLVRDYMGSDLAGSGSKTVTNGLSIVDEAMLLKNVQIREAELKAWAEKEKEFYQKKQEWVENINFLKKTGEDRFKSITQEFTNSWDEWRRTTDEKIAAESQKYTDQIKTAITEQKNWMVNFSQQASQSNEQTLRQLYDSIVQTTAELKAGLPTNVDIDLLDANTLLQKYLANKPSNLSNSITEAAKNVNIDFFINEITGKGYDSAIQERYAALQKEMKQKGEVMVRLQKVYELFSIKDQYADIIKAANEALKYSLDQEMMSYGWMVMNGGYTLIKTVGDVTAPFNIEGYKFYEYKPVEIPKIKDAFGKEWDLRNVESLLGDNAPSGAELGAMVIVAQESLDKEFKKQYEGTISKNCVNV